MRTSYNKKLNIFFGILSASVFFSCLNTESNKQLIYSKKYENGNIEFKKFSIRENDTFDIEYKVYYPDANIKRIFHEKDGKENGSDFSYYPNGEIESKGEWFAGRKKGIFHFYDTHGNLRKIIQYINYRDSIISRPNQIINFDENGDTIKNGSFYFDEYIKKDTISKSEKYWFKIRLTSPLFDKAYLKLCDFDEKYNLLSDSNCNIAHLKNFEVMLAPKRYVLGKNFLRGAIVNYQIFEDIYGKDSMTQAVIYFTDSFYVTP